MNNPFLVGERIYFRPLDVNDLERLIKWINDPEITVFLTMGRFPVNSIREKEWLENLYRSQDEVVMGM